MVIALERVFLRFSLPIVAAMFLLTIGCVFFWVPTDAGLGLSQRIFYYHVPAATVSFLGFGAGGVASALFLANGRSEWDMAARASISVAMVFATMVLVTGSIWARTAW